MKRRTYNNMLKAVKMIAAKGYDWETANKIAMNIFDQVENNKYGLSVEGHINQIMEKGEYAC